MRRPSASSWVGALVSVVSLGAVAWWISRQEPPQLPSSAAGYGWLVAALGVSAVTLLLRSWRWGRIMSRAAVPYRARDALGLTLVAYMGNTVLPARGGELLKIGLLGPRTTARRREILGTVIADRLLDAVVLAVLFVALTWIGVEGAPDSTASAAVAAAALAFTAAGLATYLRLRRGGRFHGFAATIRPVARASRLFARRDGVGLAALSVVIWTLEGVSFLLIAHAVGVELSMLAAVAVVAIASLFAAIPAAPGYAGTFDAGIIVGLHAADVAGSAAVSVLLLARFMLFVPVTIAGFVVLVVGYGGLRAGRRGASPGALADDEELLAEQAPRERSPKVLAREGRAGG